MPHSRLIDRFEAQAALCTDDPGLRELMEHATRALGFSHFALLHHQALGSGSSRLIKLHDYPSAWEQEIVREPLAGTDPVHQASLRANIGFSWSELPRLVRMGPASRRFLDRAKQHGIGDGFTVPVNVPGEPAGSCSFAVAPAVALPLQRLLSAEQVGAHAFRAARRIHGFPGRAGSPHLSRRERQCVRLVAAGKSDWEIGRILGISAETAHFYVKRARAAYDVVSRAQLVACGLRDALISFEDAIPPSG